MVYCGKPSKGCALCRAKRTKVRASADILRTAYLLAPPQIYLPGFTREINDASVTKLARFVANAGGLKEIAQDTAMSRMRCFVTKLVE